ncbi:MAG: tetratricopeptide repeat protein [Rhodospirillales bacterium]
MNFARISAFWVVLVSSLVAQDPPIQAQQMEQRGDAATARQLLQRAARNAPDDPSALLNYAEFLDRYNDPETRANYEKALALLNGSADAARRAAVARRLVLLDLIEGEREAAARRLEIYRAAGGKDFAAGLPAARPERRRDVGTIKIPGPLHSFARMAAVSADVSAADLMPALARNVITNGYQAASGSESLEPTEYMKLINRYLSQARELEKLAGEQETIRIDACESPQTGELLRILGYRMRGGCGSDVVLETVNATRAFLTIDSGFPLAQLEQALRTNRPFTYEYSPTETEVLYGPDYWLSPRERESGEFIDVFLSDPNLCRFYLGMVKLDPETAAELKKVPVQRLRAFAHVLDFYGGMFQIRGGKAVVPGGARSAAAWADLAGKSPDEGAAFFERLISRDDGWMASYFDALARISGPVQDYLTEPDRMKRFYAAIRGRVTSPGPARPVFRANTDMMLLTTRLRLGPDGRPHIPGSLDVWKTYFAKAEGKWDSKLAQAAPRWKEPDDVLEALFALCRKSVENEPLKVFMALSDLDRWRTKPLEAATVSRLAQEYRVLGAQYPVFTEAPGISDQTVIRFLDTALAINRIGNMELRADAAGMMQALTGLWQIFCRQQSIPASHADWALASILHGFAEVRNRQDLFDAGRSGVGVLLKATGAPETATPQERIVDLLVGTASTDDSESQNYKVQEMIRIFEAQRLVSLNVLFGIADNLERIPQGEKLNTALVNRLASRISEIQSPRSGLSNLERNAYSFGYWAERHLESERKLNIGARVERAGTDAERLREIRGELAPLLRDTLVGFNYMHYAPPGAQLLLTNPAFVRTHDFLGYHGSLQTWKNTEVVGSGWPSSAGGRLVGSLSSLPYALAEAEQNFLVPAREQALIWADLVPQMILTATIPRWWNVTPEQMHWVGLHMRYAATVMAEAALDPEQRTAVISVLEQQAPPARARRVADLLEQGEVRSALESVTPSEMFLLAQRLLPNEKNPAAFPVSELRRLERQYPDRVNYAAISRAFGTPKPTLTNSYQPELLHLRTFPTLMGFSSRILAESWESTLLYWAALADEVHISPSQLNVLIPEWTQQTIEKIFATHLEDWPAVLRSLRRVGEDVRLKLRIRMEDQNASLQQLMSN